MIKKILTRRGASIPINSLRADASVRVGFRTNDSREESSHDADVVGVFVGA